MPGRSMGMISGFALLALGFGLVFLGLPRTGEDVRPFLRDGLLQVAYISLCLVLISLGAAFFVSEFLGGR